MARQKRTSRLLVALNGRHMGNLDRSNNGAVSFTYAADWLADMRRAIPVSLSLPLREERYVGAPVLAYFDNLLPENDPIRRKVAERVGAEGTDAFSMLDKIGRDCVGALQFVPDGDDIAPPGPPEGEPVDDAAVAGIIRNLATAPLGIRTDKDRDFRISLAGVQEKTALLWTNGWQIPKGGTPTTHILKPQLGKLPNGLDMSDSVENEHFCLTLCAEFGLDVAGSQIIDFEDKRVLVVERFDRRHTKDGRLLRLPQEDFCQALGVPATRKYNNEGGPGIGECLHLLGGSDYADEDRRHFLKAQMLFWLLGATDGHAKNFSLYLAPGGGYRMTPFYDIMSAEPNLARHELRRQEMKLAMAVGDRRHYPIDTIYPRHFLQSGKAAAMDPGEIEEIYASIQEAADGAAERARTKMLQDLPEEVVVRISEAVQMRLRRPIQEL
ncbi:type II toxin-antitoxin system HipA family toxin [Kordiimonas gwangyangensis]|uniref:type II toxin-antitoxin system HipA family toxin n=1 Tax=Kordiimonas gwangyangensis TaxID=288022 RepID=UPI0003643662|nr:type II toxin-antitoxin system HipA family toxin [Kordiimonas gwangyangensis]